MDLNRIQHIVLNNMSEAVYTRDADMNILYMNPAAERLTGWSLKDLTGKKCYEVFVDEHAKCKDDCRADKAPAEPAGTFRREVALKTRCGAVHEIRATISPVCEEGEVVSGAVVFLEDLGRRKEREAASRFWSQNAHEMTWIIDLEMNTKHISPSVEKILGFTPRERMKGKALDQLTPESRDLALKTIVAELQRDGDPGVDPHRTVRMELDYYRKDGSVTCLEGVVGFIRDDALKPTGVYGLSRDITERKRVDEALRESEQRFRSMFLRHDAIMLLIEPDTGQILDANLSAQRFYGYELSELLQMTIQQINRLSPDEVARERKKALLEERNFFTFPHRLASGEVRTVEVHSSPIEVGGKPILFSIIHDITDREKAEQALRESEAKFKYVFESANAGKSLTLPTGEINVNKAFCDMLGYSQDELKHKTWQELTPTEDVAPTLELLDALLKGDRDSVRFNKRVIHKNGGYIWGDLSVTIRRDREGKPLFFITTVVDITDRKKAEEDLRRERERLSFVIEASRLGTWIWNVQTNEIIFNNTWAEMLGYTLDELTPYDYETWARLVHPDDLKNAQEALSRCVEGESRDCECEFRMKHKDGHWVWILSRGRIMVRDAEGKPLSMFGTHTDISDIKRTQELLLQSERFRAVADLAGGVAHNFNNLLHIVMGNAELALLDLESGDYSDVERALQNVLASSKLGADTVRKLQSFASIRDHTRGSEQEVFDLSDIARQSVEMTKPWWKTNPEKRGLEISVNMELQDGCLVRARKNEFFEVVVNLINNATEALPKGGDLDVQTRLEGDSVILRVRDTGVGMSEDHLKRLFNPFFTTKAGAGAGLGLASSRKIVEASGGNILAESAVGMGTTFTIQLPLAKHFAKEAPSLAPHVSGAGTTVLVMDDMEDTLELIRAMLTRFGYSVVTATTGLHGLEIFRDNPIDVVICDLGMPGMNGWEVGKRVKAICEERGIPKTPFLLLTGWGGQKTEAAHIAESGVDTVVEKPINMEGLRDTLRRLTEK